MHPRALSTIRPVQAVHGRTTFSAEYNIGYIPLTHLGNIVRRKEKHFCLFSSGNRKRTTHAVAGGGGGMRYAMWQANHMTAKILYFVVLTRAVPERRGRWLKLFYRRLDESMAPRSAAMTAYRGASGVTSL